MVFRGWRLLDAWQLGYLTSEEVKSTAMRNLTWLENGYDLNNLQSMQHNLIPSPSARRSKHVLETFATHWNRAHKILHTGAHALTFHLDRYGDQRAHTRCIDMLEIFRRNVTHLDPAKFHTATCYQPLRRQVTEEGRVGSGAAPTLP